MKYEKPVVTVLFAKTEDVVTESTYEPSKDYNVGEGWF